MDLKPIFDYVGRSPGATTAEIKSAVVKMRFVSVEITEEKSIVRVPEEVRNALQDKLHRGLYGNNMFGKGTDLKIRYRFIQYDPGNRLARWFHDFREDHAGEEGSLTIQVNYFDATDRKLSTILTKGEVGAGPFGGSFNSAVNKAAKAIVKYTRKTFR